jgi:quercetin dioxygenase-like cupin family protein
MPFYKKSELPSKEVVPGITLRSVYLENSMMTFFDLEPASAIPSHKHPHEQITYLVRGSLEMTVDGETRIMVEGDIAVVPPEVEHFAVTGEQPTLAVDSWYPIREDYVLDK